MKQIVHTILLCISLCYTMQTTDTEFPQDIHTLVRGVVIQHEHILCAYDPRLTKVDGSPVFYYLPGGHIEYQESAQDALTREMKEEINTQCTVDHFIGVFERSWLGKPQSIKCHKHEVTLVFSMTLPTDDSKELTTITPQEKNVAFAWIPVSEINNIDLRPSLLKQHLNTWLTTTPPTTFVSQMHLQ